MELKFNNTSWEKTKDDHHIIVWSDSGLTGWSICFVVILGDKILLQLYIRNKEHLKYFWKLMHIAGVMMSKGEEITSVDRSEFISTLGGFGIKFPPDNETANNEKADQYARQIQKYGRDLWELLGESNLMFLLS